MGKDRKMNKFRRGDFLVKLEVCFWCNENVLLHREWKGLLYRRLDICIFRNSTWCRYRFRIFYSLAPHLLSPLTSVRPSVSAFVLSPSSLRLREREKEREREMKINRFFSFFSFYRESLCKKRWRHLQRRSRPPPPSINAFAKWFVTFVMGSGWGGWGAGWCRGRRGPHSIWGGAGLCPNCRLPRPPLQRWPLRVEGPRMNHIEG